MTRGRVLAPLAQQLLQSERGVGGAAPRPEAALRLIMTLRADRKSVV